MRSSKSACADSMSDFAVQHLKMNASPGELSRLIEYVQIVIDNDPYKEKYPKLLSTLKGI